MVSRRLHGYVAATSLFLLLWPLAAGAGPADAKSAQDEPDEPGQDEADPSWDDVADDGWVTAPDATAREGEMSVPGQKDVHDLAEAKEQKEAGDVQSFMKGELSAAGRIQLVSRYHRIGLNLGATGFARELYARAEPMLDLNFEDSGLKLGFGAPINFLIGDFGQTMDRAFKNSGEFRMKDWDSISDILQVIRYASYGGKEQPFYVSLSQLDSTTIGHGTVIRRYVSNADVNHHRVGGQFDAYNDYGGFELYLNDIASPDILAVLTFLKPGRLISDDRPLKRLSIGAHYTTDLGAPTALQCSSEVVLKHDPKENCEEALRKGYIAVSGDRPFVASDEAIHFVGMSVEFKPIRTGSADVKPYLDYTQMMSYGAGATLGLLGRFSIGEKRNAAVRLRLEGRSYDANYMPAYFDILYEVDRFVSLGSINESETVRTKLAYLKSKEGEERRLGFYGEMTYAQRGWFAFTGAWEQANTAASKSLMLHLELPASKWFTLFFTYVKRNFDAFDSDPIDFRRSDIRDITEEIDISDELFFWAFRIKVLPILAFNWRGQKAFEVKSKMGLPPRYTDAFQWTGTVEMGYEF